MGYTIKIKNLNGSSINVQSEKLTPYVYIKTSDSSHEHKVNTTTLSNPITCEFGEEISSSNIIELTSDNGCSLREISNEFAKGSSTLVKIDLPTVTRIGGQAFSACMNLESINLPNVTTIVNMAFIGLKKVTTLNFPNVTSIGNTSFAHCEGISDVYIPKMSTTMVQSANYFGLSGSVTFHCSNNETIVTPY